MVDVSVMVKVARPAIRCGRPTTDHQSPGAAGAGVAGLRDAPPARGRAASPPGPASRGCRKAWPSAVEQNWGISLSAVSEILSTDGASSRWKFGAARGLTDCCLASMVHHVACEIPVSSRARLPFEVVRRIVENADINPDGTRSTRSLASCSVRSLFLSVRVPRCTESHQEAAHD